MWPYKLSLEITTYSSLILGLFVLLRNRNSRLNQIFFIFSLLVANYSFFLEKVTFASSFADATFYARFLYIGVILIPAVYFHLTLLMVKAKSKLLYWFYGVSLFFLTLLPTDLFIAGSRYFSEYGIYSLHQAFMFYPFLLFFFGVVVYSFYLSSKEYAQSRGLQKIQLAYFIYGSGLGFIGGSMDYFPKFGIFIPWINSYCNYLIVFYVVSFAYAIIKYRLMDIQVIIRKGLIYSTLIAISTGLYLFAIYTIGQLLQFTVGHNPLWAGGLLIFVFVFAFQPLKQRVQEMVDKIFFKSRYEYQNTLKQLSQVAVSVMDVNELNKLVTEKVTQVMKIKNASIIVLKDNKRGN